jgi:hypothetical protein
MGRGLEKLKLICDKSDQIHITCLAALESAMYLASVKERAMVGCLLLAQETTPPPIRNVYPVIDHQLLGLLPQSKLLNLMTSESSMLPKHK